MRITILVLGLLSACAPLGGPGWYAPPQSSTQERHVRVNGVELDARGRETLAQLEGRSGQRVPDGDYWYDPRSGAAGRWGGPVASVLPAGLALGGPLPANASGGGTGIYINGRDIHPIDAQNLYALVGPVAPGRYWVDAQGNAGLEGGPALVNLYAAAQQAQQRGGGKTPWSSRVDAMTGRSSDNLNLASDGTTTCVSTGSYSRCTGE